MAPSGIGNFNTGSGSRAQFFLSFFLPFFFLQAIGAKGLHKPLYRPPRRKIHIWRQSGLVPRTSDKVYGGHRVFTANHGGNRAALGQPPRHFARILHEGGGLHAGMAAVSNQTCGRHPYKATKREKMGKWNRPTSQPASASPGEPRRCETAARSPAKPWLQNA